VHPDDNTHIEVVRYGKGQDFMALTTTVLTGGGPPWPRWLRWVGNIFRHPVQFLRTLNPFGWARRSAILLVMQPLDSHLSLRPGMSPMGGGLTSRMVEGKAPPTYIPLADNVARRLAERMKGTPQSLLPEVVLNTSSTAHILGGATMGATPNDGVCDATGRVFGYENLFVADGSIVPANLGVNPTLTITALSEYVMSTVPDKPGAEAKPAPRPARREALAVS
jgi:cholesterol oxidase